MDEAVRTIPHSISWTPYWRLMTLAPGLETPFHLCTSPCRVALRAQPRTRVRPTDSKETFPVGSGCAGFTGDVNARADDLRITAFETLLESVESASAQSVLASVDTTTAGMTAGAREKEQRWISAVLLYERAGMEGAASMARSTGIQALLETGESLMDTESFPEALDAFNSILFLDEDNIEALDLRGECFYELGEYDRAIADYTRVIDSDSPYENIADVYHGRALSYAGLREFDKALSDCLNSISIDPEEAETRVMAAQLYRGSGVSREGHGTCISRH